MRPCHPQPAGPQHNSVWGQCKEERQCADAWVQTFLQVTSHTHKAQPACNDNLTTHPVLKPRPFKGKACSCCSPHQPGMQSQGPSQRAYNHQPGSTKACNYCNTVLSNANHPDSASIRPLSLQTRYPGTLARGWPSSWQVTCVHAGMPTRLAPHTPHTTTTDGVSHNRAHTSTHTLICNATCYVTGNTLSTDKQA